LGGGILGNPPKVEVSHKKNLFEEEALRREAGQEEVI